MIRIICHTNLDLEIGDKNGFPTQLPEVPKVGDSIESSVEWRNGARLRLKVVSVTWKYCKDPFQSRHDSLAGKTNWYPEVELHIANPNWSIKDFYEWYGRITGKGAHAYI